jgi:DNA replication and repair protein RecF
MLLRELELRNVRLYGHARFDFDEKLNLISGGNASGKTTLLEAIHILSTGRSFRTRHIEQILSHNANELSISALCRTNSQNPGSRVRFTLDPGGRKTRINDKTCAKAADTAQLLPLLVISPDSHFSFYLESRERRAVLDWVLFHVEPKFQSTWNRFQRVLQQRNASLKTLANRNICRAWNDEFSKLGDEIHGFRNSCLVEISSKFKEICQNLLPNNPKSSLQLDCGWDPQKKLPQCLIEDQQNDEKSGFTHSGPHRADLEILISGKQSKEEASHGQNKLLVIALRLAQVQYLHEITGMECCLLIDDMAAELDFTHRNKLNKILAKMPVQVFLTATDLDQIDFKPWPSHKWFHVEHGAINQQET